MDAPNMLTAWLDAKIPVRLPIKLLAYRYAGEWVVECLEFSLKTFGDTLYDALRSLRHEIGTQALLATLRGKRPIRSLPPCSHSTRLSFEQAQRVNIDNTKLMPAGWQNLGIPGTKTRLFIKELRVVKVK